MSINLFLIILFSLTIFYLIIGYFASKNVNTINDYFLAGRKLGFFSVTFTLIAIQLGGGMLLGTSQKAYEIGIYGILYTIGISLGFILLSLGIASRLREMNVNTTAQLFEVKYNSIFLRKFASLLSVATMSGILICQIVASKTLFNAIGIQNNIIFIFFWLFIISYTIIGGLKAVAMTDAAQVLFIILIFGGLFIYNIINSKDIFTTILQVTKNANFTLDYQMIFKLIPILVMPALFSLIEQDLAQQFFASKTKKIATFSAIAASVFMTLFALIPIYFGSKAKVLGYNLDLNCSPLMVFLQNNTNDFILALAICGIIAAITSTANSLLCAISSNISQDFNLNIFRINPLHFSKTITLIMGIVALLTSYIITNDIIDILIESYQISVACLLVPTMFSLFSEKLNKNSAIISILFGLISFITFKFFAIPLSGIFALIFSYIGFLMGKNLR